MMKETKTTRKEVIIMYDNEIYSGSGAGNNTSGVYSGGNAADSSSNYSNTQYRDYSTYQTEGNAFAGGGNAFAGGGASGEKEKKQQKVKSGGKGVFRKVMLSVSMGLLFGLFAGLGFVGVQQGAGAFAANESNSVSEANSSSQTDNSHSGIALANTNNVTVVDSDISSVVEEVMPAMVSIVNNYIESGTIFGQTYSQPGTSGGSGIIVAENEKELLIVTNYHVVADAEELKVTFIDNSEAEASIKGTDSDMDLAVIAIPLDSLSEETRNNISIATLGDSDSLKLGEPVIAIGNALGYGQSVTNGIISALNREIMLEDGSTNTFIQTNAAINHGNSGGALLNVRGEVIGINSNKISGNSVEGMGYAIPISSASPVIADLMERQTRSKVEESEIGYLGISLQEVTTQISAMYHMPQGVYVVSTEEGSAAQNAGIISGDIITKFDGQNINSYSDLQKVLQYYASGDTALLTVMRPENGQYVSYELEITLGSRPVENR